MKSRSYRGIVLTGVSGGGKSTISSLIRNRNVNFAQVTALTTRSQRADDEQGAYEYVSQEQFDLARQSLLICDDYRGMHYGIASRQLEEVEQRGKQPILVITPRSLSTFIACIINTSEPFLTVFIDAPDELLDLRLENRGRIESQDVVYRQRLEDRAYRGRCRQALQNIHLEESLKLIQNWWNSGPIG